MRRSSEAQDLVGGVSILSEGRPRSRVRITVDANVVNRCGLGMSVREEETWCPTVLIMLCALCRCLSSASTHFRWCNSRRATVKHSASHDQHMTVHFFCNGTFRSRCRCLPFPLTHQASDFSFFILVLFSLLFFSLRSL